MPSEDYTPELSAGERRKLTAHAVFEARQELWVLRGRRALLAALLQDGTATIDAVRAAVELPAGLEPKLFGAVPGQLARAGIIRAAGYTKSTRPESHGRDVKVWGLVDPVAAAAWLRNHPDYPDGPEDPEPERPKPAPIMPASDGDTSKSLYREGLFDA